MVKAKLYNLQGENKGEVDLNSEIFEVEVNEILVHQAVVAQRGSGRIKIAKTKDRSEVRGGGAKPWRQKGTGRARHGSNRSPIWKGGGVTFGPTGKENFSKKINKKMKRKALFMVLSDKAKEGNLLILEEEPKKEVKTKQMSKLKKNLKIEKSAVLVIEKMKKQLGLAVNNIPKFNLLAADSLNVVDLLKGEKVVVSKPALQQLEKVYLKK